MYIFVQDQLAEESQIQDSRPLKLEKVVSQTYSIITHILL